MTPDRDQPICTPEAAHAAGLDIAPSPAELLATSQSIVHARADLWANPEEVTVSIADAGTQLARALPLVLAEVDRLRARVAELERPAVEAKRNEIRQSHLELAAQAREDRDYEGQASVELQLRDREEQWKREDAPAPRDLRPGAEAARRMIRSRQDAEETP